MQLGELAGNDPKAKAFMTDFQSHIGKAGAAARMGVSAAEGLRQNDTIFPDGRARMVREATDNAATITANEHAKADMTLAVWEAHLQAQVFAHDTRNDVGISAELSNFAHGVKQGDPDGKLIALAERPRYATAMASELGESLAARFGVSHQSMIDASFRGLTKGGTPAQQAAAASLKEFHKARRVLTLSKAGADNARRVMQTPNEPLAPRRG
jgi:hypothetical protein